MRKTKQNETIDVLHSYMGVAVLSLLNETDIQDLEPALNIPSSALKHLKGNTVFWKKNK